MKAIITILSLVFICSSKQMPSLGHTGVGSIHTYKIKGHEYIIVTNGTSQSGICIIHSESCSCHTPKIVHDTVYIIKKAK